LDDQNNVVCERMRRKKKYDPKLRGKEEEGKCNGIVVVGKTCRKEEEEEGRKEGETLKRVHHEFVGPTGCLSA